MTHQLYCPDCDKPIVEERACGHLLGTRCGCPEKHWSEQDKAVRKRLAVPSNSLGEGEKR